MIEHKRHDGEMSAPASIQPSIKPDKYHYPRKTHGTYIQPIDQGDEEGKM